MLVPWRDSINDVTIVKYHHPFHHPCYHLKCHCQCSDATTSAVSSNATFHATFDATVNAPSDVTINTDTDATIHAPINTPSMLAPMPRRCHHSIRPVRLLSLRILRSSMISGMKAQDIIAIQILLMIYLVQQKYLKCQPELSGVKLKSQMYPPALTNYTTNNNAA